MRNSPRTFCPRKSGPRGVRRPESLRKMIGRDFMDFGAGFFIEWEFAKPPGLPGRNQATSFPSGAPATEPLHPARGEAGGHWCALTGSDDAASILSCPVVAHLTVRLQSSLSAKRECGVRSAELSRREESAECGILTTARITQVCADGRPRRRGCSRRRQSALNPSLAWEVRASSPWLLRYRILLSAEAAEFAA
jgi:hypothetical protein